MKYKNMILDQAKINVYIEGRKTKTFVGLLEMKEEPKRYIFTYDKSYLRAENSIPLGPDIPLRKMRHEVSGKLFASFKDRIPSRRNPAYEDYCRQEGISVKEKNPIILLGSIGRRGPSSFIFEAIFEDVFDIVGELKKFRDNTGISLRDLAAAFELNYVTLQRIQSGKSKDASTIRLIRIFLSYPECLYDQIERTKSKLHQKTYCSLVKYVEMLST